MVNIWREILLSEVTSVKVSDDPRISMSSCGGRSVRISKGISRSLASYHLMAKEVNVGTNSSSKI